MINTFFDCHVLDIHCLYPKFTNTPNLSYSLLLVLLSNPGLTFKSFKYLQIKFISLWYTNAAELRCNALQAKLQQYAMMYK